MTGDESRLLRGFQDGSLVEFHHRDHVHLAWIYVREHGLEDGLPRFVADLRAFARAKGAPHLFHATITWAYLTLVAERRALTPDLDWDAFAQAHGDLLVWKPSILDRYYSAERLWSETARACFVLPDTAYAGLAPRGAPR
ncbi:MAG: hypothetical protein AB7O67_00650 [Vicinamibacterales bacterium]